MHASSSCSPFGRVRAPLVPVCGPYHFMASVCQSVGYPPLASSTPFEPKMLWVRTALMSSPSSSFSRGEGPRRYSDESRSVCKVTTGKALRHVDNCSSSRLTAARQCPGCPRSPRFLVSEPVTLDELLVLAFGRRRTLPFLGGLADLIPRL